MGAVRGRGLGGDMNTHCPARGEVLETLAAHGADLARFGVARLALIGSVARDEAGPDSDVDLVVDFAGPATFDAYAGLALFLEDLLGRSVDLVTRRSLRPHVAREVEKEAIDVKGLQALSR
jgi:uncharacterized protein